MTANNVLANELPTVGMYRIDPERSKVSYSGRHLWGLGVVHATFLITSGELRIADPSTASTVAVSINADSFTSGNAKRDKDVRSAALLDTATYPAITFVSDNLTRVVDHWVLRGTVTAHGTSKPAEVVFDQVVHEPGGMRVHAHAKHLDRYALGVTGSKGMVGRHLDLDIDIYASPT